MFHCEGLSPHGEAYGWDENGIARIIVSIDIDEWKLI
jgi:hypothetical protein